MKTDLLPACLTHPCPQPQRPLRLCQRNTHPLPPLPPPRIILNKTDLVGKPALEALEARIRSINAMASMLPTQRSVVPVDYVLGVGGFDLEKVEEQVGGRRAGGGAV